MLSRLIHFLSLMSTSLVERGVSPGSALERRLVPAKAGTPVGNFRVGNFSGGKRAFTLLEMMIAMIIISVLIPVLYNAMHVGFRTKADAEAAVEPAHAAEMAFDWLRQDLNGAMPPTGVLAGSFVGTNGTDDRGRDGDDLLFYSVTDAPQHADANGEIKSVELTVMTSPNGTDHLLVRKLIPNLLTQSAPNPDIEVVCRGVGGFNLRYFDGLNWNDTWDSTQENNVLPNAVEVTLTLDRPNGPIANPDGTHSFRFTQVIPIACSTLVGGVGQQQ